MAMARGKRKRERESERNENGLCLRCLVWRWWNEKARSAQGGFGHGLGFGARAGRAAGRAEGPTDRDRGSPGFRPGRPALVLSCIGVSFVRSWFLYYFLDAWQSRT